MFGSAKAGRSRSGFRGQDYNYELHLKLRDATNTHKQVLNIAGKNIRITVPAGVADGQKIKLKGQGGAGANGGPAGDLFLTFILERDSTFKREGDDLFATVPLDLYTAILGGEHIIETLNGAVKMKVKPETQQGTRVRLKGKGFPIYKKEGAYGDLYITYTIHIPTHLTEEQRTLFNTLRDLQQ
jgi:curved DNA-binding protein